MNLTTTKPMCGALADPMFCDNYSITNRWIFNERSQKLIDLCGNKHGIVIGPTWKGSKMGGGLYFDGSNDYVDVGAFINKNDSFTVSVWCTKTATGDDILFYNGWSASNGWGYYTTGEKHAWLKGLVAIIDSGISIPLNTLQNITWVIDSSKRPTLYINGASVYTSSNTGGNAPSGSFAFGNAIGASNYYSGTIDQVIIANRVWTPLEVNHFYNNPFSGLISQSSPVQYKEAMAATGA